ERQAGEGDWRGIPIAPRLLLPFCPDFVVALGDSGFALGVAGRELALARDALLAQPRELRNAERGIAQGADRAGLHAAIVERPLADIDLAEADLDEVARCRRESFARARGVVDLGELLLPIIHVET